MPHHPKYFSVCLQQTSIFSYTLLQPPSKWGKWGWYMTIVRLHPGQFDWWFQECPFVRTSQSRITVCIWPQAFLVSFSLEHHSTCFWPFQPWPLWREQSSFVESPTVLIYWVWHIWQGPHRRGVPFIYLISSCQIVCSFSFSLSQSLPLKWISI